MITRSVVLRRSLEKTLPDYVAAARGRLPSFVFGGKLRTLPILTYHVVDSRFELQLRRLKEAGYRTVGAEELEAFARGERPKPKSVALTFDDGDASLISVAAPLLTAYGFRGIAFVVSGLVPPVSNDKLAGWNDLRQAVQTGVFEVGAHSLFHHHVPVAPTILGFVDPTTPTEFAANIPIPRARGDTRIELGAPVLRGKPRYTAPRAFRPDPEALSRTIAIVARRGPGYFSQKGWARELAAEVKLSGSFESHAEADAAVVDDIRQAIALIDANCPNAAARHLCYPWYSRDTRTDRLAHQAGATTLYGGVLTRTRAANAGSSHLLQRLPPDFLWRLPGPGRLSLAAILGRRVQAILGR